jgi:hypothetical protein
MFVWYLRDPAPSLRALLESRRLARRILRFAAKPAPAQRTLPTEKLIAFIGYRSSILATEAIS